MAEDLRTSEHERRIKAAAAVIEQMESRHPEQAIAQAALTAADDAVPVVTKHELAEALAEIERLQRLLHETNMEAQRYKRERDEYRSLA